MSIGGKPGHRLDRIDTAVVFIDPQNDVLNEKGKAWALVGESVRENKTVENMERIFKAAKVNAFEVFISPHYFFPTDSGWKFNGPLEASEVADKLFSRRGVLNLDGFSGSGADWLERFKPYIDDGKTHRRQSPPGVWASDQRPGPAAPQAAHREGDPRRDAGEHVRRIAPARPAGAGF